MLKCFSQRIKIRFLHQCDAWTLSKTHPSFWNVERRCDTLCYKADDQDSWIMAHLIPLLLKVGSWECPNYQGTLLQNLNFDISYVFRLQTETNDLSLSSSLFPSLSVKPVSLHSFFHLCTHKCYINTYQHMQQNNYTTERETKGFC